MPVAHMAEDRRSFVAGYGTLYDIVFEAAPDSGGEQAARVAERFDESRPFGEGFLFGFLVWFILLSFGNHWLEFFIGEPVGRNRWLFDILLLIISIS